MKLLWVIAMAMISVLWMHYCDIDKKRVYDQMIANYRFQATNEVLAMHSEAINAQTKLLKQIVEYQKVRS
jgi:hypothetical protein